MPRLICPEWLALGFILFAAGCSVPTVGLRAVATAVPDQSTSTHVARMEYPTTSATPEGMLPETIPPAAPSDGPSAETLEVVKVPVETPRVSVVEASVEDDVAPLETPTVAVVAEAEDEKPGLDEAGLGRRPTDRQLEILAGLQSYGPGPELPNDVWLNSEPLKLADLRGKVVLVEFWTFG